MQLSTLKRLFFFQTCNKMLCFFWHLKIHKKLNTNFFCFFKKYFVPVSTLKIFFLKTKILPQKYPAPFFVLKKNITRKKKPWFIFQETKSLVEKNKKPLHVRWIRLRMQNRRLLCCQLTKRSWKNRKSRMLIAGWKTVCLAKLVLHHTMTCFKFYSCWTTSTSPWRQRLQTAANRCGPFLSPNTIRIGATCWNRNFTIDCLKSIAWCRSKTNSSLQRHCQNL